LLRNIKFNVTETLDNLFNNKEKLSEGNMYGILIHGPRGVAVNGITNKMNFTNINLLIENCVINELKTNGKIVTAISNSKTKELIGSSYGGIVQNDAGGALFEIEKVIDKNNKYIPNELANAQLYVAKFGEDYNKGKSSISKLTIDWAENKTETPVNDAHYLITGGDFMFHVAKPLYGIRIDAMTNVKLNKITINELSQFGEKWKNMLNDYKIEQNHPNNTLNNISNTDIVGIGFACSSGIDISDISINNLSALHGNIKSVDTSFNTNITNMKNINFNN